MSANDDRAVGEEVVGGGGETTAGAEDVAVVFGGEETTTMTTTAEDGVAVAVRQSSYSHQEVQDMSPGQVIEAVDRGALTTPQMQRLLGGPSSPAKTVKELLQDLLLTRATAETSAAETAAAVDAKAAAEEAQAAAEVAQAVAEAKAAEAVAKVLK